MSPIRSPPRSFPQHLAVRSVIQSAGSDGVYVGKEERGGKIATGGALSYGLNFRGSPSSDIMADFDDILVAGGG